MANPVSLPFWRARAEGKENSAQLSTSSNQLEAAENLRFHSVWFAELQEKDLIIVGGPDPCLRFITSREQWEYAGFWHSGTMEGYHTDW